MIRKNSTNWYIIFSILCVFVSVWGNFRISDIHIAGIVPTYFRIIVPIIFLMILLFYDRNNTDLTDTSRRPEFLFYIVVAAWVVVGCLSLFVSSYSNFSVGLKELLVIVLGTFVVFIVAFLIREQQFEMIILSLKIVVCATVVIGIIEIITSQHLYTSRLAEDSFINWCAETYGWTQPYNQYLHKATGIFYNENDFCTFLAIFAPMFLYFTKYEHNVLLKAADYVLLLLINIIILVNDGFICILSMLIGMILILIMKHAKPIEWIVSVLVFVLGRIISNISIENTLISQVQGVQKQTGSLAQRINTYIESLRETVFTSHGLGFGAGSFEKYFAPIAEERNMMSNPHCLWNEILFQYGVIILLIFVAYLVYMVVKLFAKYRQEQSNECAVVIAMGITFAFACFAPSSYLQGTYYWVLIGLGIGLITQPQYANSRKSDIIIKKQEEK